jgi:hypothetical protein
MISYDHEFIIACDKGDLETVVRLYKKVHHNVRIMGFVKSYCNQQQHIVEWLCAHDDFGIKIGKSYDAK